MLDQEVFSAAGPTSEVPVLLGLPNRDSLEGKIMYQERNLDPGPCGGNALSSVKGSLCLG